jgi:penicillin amidase
MAWELRGNMDSEIESAMLLGSLSEAQVAQLFPPYPGEINPYIVAASDNQASLEPSVSASLRSLPAVRAALSSAQHNMDLLAAVGASDPEAGIDSNSWVASGEHTNTGAPILANDPRLASQMPSIWFQNGLHRNDVALAFVRRRRFLVRRRTRRDRRPQCEYRVGCHEPRSRRAGPAR